MKFLAAPVTKIRDNPLVAMVGLLAAVVAGVAGFADSAQKLVALVRPPDAAPAWTARWMVRQ